MPSLSTEWRFIFGFIAAVAGILSALIGNELAKNFIYLLSRRGRPPAKRSPVVWLMFFLSVAILLSLGTLAAYAPAISTNTYVPILTPIVPLPAPTLMLTIAPSPTQTPISPGRTYSLRFVGNCPAEREDQNHNLYYIADDGNPQHLASIGGQIDKSFQAKFSRSIRVYIEINSGITCSEMLFVNKNGSYELVASGNVGNNGLVYQP